MACLLIALLPVGGCASSLLPVLSLSAALTSTRRAQPRSSSPAGSESLRSVVLMSAAWRSEPPRSRAAPPRRRRRVATTGPCTRPNLCAWELRARTDALLALGARP